MQKAAKNGHVESMCKYGIVLSKNPKLKKESLLFLKESSNRNNIKSMYHYSISLLNSEDIQKNTEEALLYLQISALSGNIDAMIRYADMLRMGDYVNINTKEALNFYKMTIERGNEYALNIYTDMLQHENKKIIESSSIIEMPKTITNPKEDVKKTKKKSSLQPIYYNPQKRVKKKESTVHRPVINMYDIGIYTEKVEPQIVSDGKYLFYFTGGNKDMLLKGIEVDLDESYDPNQCNEHLLSILKNFVDIKDKQLLIYLPGGIPFNSGTLEKISNNKIIYGVLTRHISSYFLQSSYPELCNISDPNSKRLISPLVNSSNLGLSDMACLLGYLNHGGSKSDLLLRTCAMVIHFPPLITSMYRIIDNSEVFGSDIINVTSTLYTFFRAYIPPLCSDNKVFEYGLRMCNLISHINDVPERIPLLRFELIPEVEYEDLKLFYDMKLGPIVYFWKGDTGEQFQWFELKIISEKAIENAFNVNRIFIPIEPNSMRVKTRCAIVKGKDHEYLYLKHMQQKDKSISAEIIDPMIGITEIIDTETFAKEQYRGSFDKTANLIDSDQVKQIILIDFDESKSMISNLNGYFIPQQSEDYHRVTIAHQYMTTFSSRLYGYNIKCIQGLISFNSKINI